MSSPPVGDAHRQVLTAVAAALKGLPMSGDAIYESPADALKALEAEGSTALVVEPLEIPTPEDLSEDRDTDRLERHDFTFRVIVLAVTVDDRDRSGAEVKRRLLVEQPPPGFERRYAGSSWDRKKEGEREFFAVGHRFTTSYLIRSSSPDELLEG